MRFPVVPVVQSRRNPKSFPCKQKKNAFVLADYWIAAGPVCKKGQWKCCICTIISNVCSLFSVWKCSDHISPVAQTLYPCQKFYACRFKDREGALLQPQDENDACENIDKLKGGQRGWLVCNIALGLPHFHLLHLPWRQAFIPGWLGSERFLTVVVRLRKDNQSFFSGTIGESKWRGGHAQ